jgi:branched-chain amino acid transport system substrate-binding protein
MRKENATIRLSVLVVGLTIVGLILPAYAAEQTPTAQANPIKIGALLSFTGTFANYGLGNKAGLEMRLDEAKYQVAGRPVKLIIEDDATSNSIVVEKAKKLVTVDKVDVIIGPLNVGLAMAVGPYLAQNKIPQINMITMPREGGKFGHAIGPFTTMYAGGMPMGWYAYDKLGYRKIVTLGDDFLAGRRFVAGAADMFIKRGGTVVQQQWVPLGTADFGPYITAMKKADALVVWLNYIEEIRLLRQMKEFGVKMPVLTITCDQFESVTMKELGGLIEGRIGSLVYSSRIDNPANKKFVAACEAKLRKNAEKMEYVAYTAVSIFLDAVNSTGGDTSFEKLRPAMLAIKKEFPQGPLFFDSSGFSIINHYIGQAKVINGVYMWDIIQTYPQVRDPNLQ